MLNTFVLSIYNTSYLSSIVTFLNYSLALGRSTSSICIYGTFVRPLNGLWVWAIGQHYTFSASDGTISPIIDLASKFLSSSSPWWWLESPFDDIHSFVNTSCSKHIAYYGCYSSWLSLWSLWWCGLLYSHYYTYSFGFCIGSY